ncbi:putative receptor-like protein kinase, partial [Tanacetum coccineum]
MNVDLFNGALRPLMDTLRAQASNGGPLKKFASGNTKGPDFTTIYALVQCTPDLSKQECNHCLEDLISQIPDLFNGKVGGRILVRMCNFRYDIQLFFNESDIALVIPPPPPLTQQPLVISPQPSPGKKKNTTHAVTIVIVTMTRSIGVHNDFFFTLYPDQTGRRKDEAIHIQSRSLVSQLHFLTLHYKSQEHYPSLSSSEYEILLISSYPSTSSDHCLTVQAQTMDIGTAESLQYDFGTVQVATNDFSEDNKLGQGGFGAVYKGVFEDGHKIAVKRLAMGSGQGDLEFKNEVLIVAKLQHRNLVRLLGFSIHGDERLLIYEFLPNGSLDYFLFALQVVVNYGASYGSLRATDFTAAAKKDDATVKWYHDSNAEISVGVPMAPPLPTDDGYMEVEACGKDTRHMIIELDYPLLETGEAILLSKLTLSVCGSKQVEALQWEPHDKVIADDRHIVIEAPLYQTMSFK